MKRTGCAALLLGAAGTVWGQTDAFSPGPYVGISAGQFTLSGTKNVDRRQITAEDRASSWKAYLGLRTSRYFGIELDYSDLGRVEAAAVTAEAWAETRAIGLTAVFYLPLGQRLSLFARGGGAYCELRAHVREAGEPVSSERFTGTAPTYAAGLDLRLAHGLSLRAEWEHIYGGDDVEAEQWNAGVKYAF